MSQTLFERDWHDGCGCGCDLNGHGHDVNKIPNQSQKTSHLKMTTRRISVVYGKCSKLKKEIKKDEILE